MKWVDTADDAIERFPDLRPVQRDEWRRLTHEERRAANATENGLVVRGVRYRGETAPWLIVGQVDTTAEADAWAVYDLRCSPPMALAAGLPERDAFHLGAAVASSRGFRAFVGATAIVGQTARAFASLVRREFGPR